jgi:hypothetical protein
LSSTASFAVRKTIGVFVALLAEAASDFEAVDVRQHPVEDHEIRDEGRDRLQRVAPGARIDDLEAFVSQRRSDCVEDRALVVHDEDLRLRDDAHARAVSGPKVRHVIAPAMAAMQRTVTAPYHHVLRSVPIPSPCATASGHAPYADQWIARHVR